MRLGMIHQPHFLPWPGYVARALAVDVFVVLDDVKFNPSHFQHRTKFVDRDGRDRWLILPINRATKSGEIANVRISAAFRFKVWQRPLRHAYGQTAEFGTTWGRLSELILREQPVLLAVNWFTLAYFLEMVEDAGGGAAPELLGSSSLRVSRERTERLVEICRQAGITHLVMGRDAERSHDCRRLIEAGIELVRHVYRGPKSKSPRPGVSFLHDVFTLGIYEAASRLREDWEIAPLT